MRVLLKASQVIDNIVDFLGKAVSYLVVLMVAIATLEVVMRRVFDRPTIWAWGINIQLFALVGMIAAAYSFRHGFFVNVDVIYGKFSPRNKRIADVLSFVFAGTFSVILIWQGWDFFWRSWTIREYFPQYFSPPMYPVKLLVPLGGFLVLLEAVAKLITSLRPPPKEAPREDK